MTKAAHYPDKPAPAPVGRRTGRALARLAPVALGLLVAACGGRDPVRMPDRWPLVTPADPAGANAVTVRALGLVGVPYRYGGGSPEAGFDCSGLVNFVYRDILDLRLPRASVELSRWSGPKLAPERLAAGDLVFFAHSDAVDHVGIYVGEGRFVHAPSSGGHVRLDRLDAPYWRTHYAGARRVLD